MRLAVYEGSDSAAQGHFNFRNEEVSQSEFVSRVNGLVIDIVRALDDGGHLDLERAKLQSLWQVRPYAPLGDYQNAERALAAIEDVIDTITELGSDLSEGDQLEVSLLRVANDRIVICDSGIPIVFGPTIEESEQNQGVSCKVDIDDQFLNGVKRGVKRNHSAS